MFRRSPRHHTFSRAEPEAVPDGTWLRQDAPGGVDISLIDTVARYGLDRFAPTHSFCR